MKASARILTLAALSLALAGCGGVTEKVGGWFGKGSKVARLPEISEQFKPLVAWHAEIGAAGDTVFTPAVQDHSVFLASADGEIARYDGLHGKLEWKIDSMHQLSSGVGLGDGLVLVGTNKGEVLAFDVKGQALWKAMISGEILSPPQVAEGIVVARTSDGRIFGLDATDGKRKWVYQRATPALTVRSYAGVTIAHGAVFAGFAGGKLVALTLGTGIVGWEATVGEPRGATELERVTDVSSLPVVDELQVCAVAYQGRIGCFDMSKGEQVWSRDISSDSGMVIHGRNLYVTDDSGAIHSLATTGGASNWRQDGLQGRRPTAPYVQDNYLAVGDVQGYVHFMSLDDGMLVARVETDGSPIVGQPVRLDDDTFLVQTQKGGVFAVAVP